MKRVWMAFGGVAAVVTGAWWVLLFLVHRLGLARISDLAGGWQPRIGDPTAEGWIAVAGYALAAGTCGMCWYRVRQKGASRYQRRDELFWLGLTAVLVFLCLNKQLDLQSLLTEMGRVIAHAQGWYRRRGIVQEWFIVGVAVAAVGALGVVLALAWGRLRSYGVVLVGTLFLLAFVVIRAASFHHVDRLLGFRLGGIKANGLLELGGIAWVTAGALRYLRQEVPPARQERA